MQDLTQTHRLLRPLRFIDGRHSKHCVASIIGPEFSSTSLVPQPVLSSISPLLHFSNSLFASLLSSGHAWRFQVLIVSLTGVAPSAAGAQTVICSSAWCQRGYFTAPDRIAASPILSRKYQRFMFDIYDPAPGGLPQTEQPMRKSRLESGSKRLSCTFTVTNMQMSSQPGFHLCSFYFRCKTRPSRGEPADELDCPSWLFFSWSHVDHTSICVVSVKVCRQTCFRRLSGPQAEGTWAPPTNVPLPPPPPTFHFVHTTPTDYPPKNLKAH